MLQFLINLLSPYILPIVGVIGGGVALLLAKRSGKKEAKQKMTTKELGRAVSAQNTRSDIDARVAASAPQNTKANPNVNNSSGQKSGQSSNASDSDGVAPYQPGTDVVRDQWSRD